MTCIICVFNPEKVIVSEDSAVSSESRTYTGVEKTIPLSNDPPMIMSFYGNSDFDDIPLENIISEYIKNTDFEKVNTIDKVKKDFLDYVHKIMPKENIEKYLNKKLISFKEDCKKLSEEDMKYYSLINFENTTLPIFEDYEFDFSNLIPNKLTTDEKTILNRNLNNIFLSTFPNELCGIVIVGIDKKTMKNGYTNFEMLFNDTNGVLICNENEELNLNKSHIKVFAQNDVIIGFFNDIDEILLSIISQELKNHMNDTLEILSSKLEYETDISKKDLKKVKEKIKLIEENSIIQQEFEDTIRNIENSNMENILNEIEIMPKHEIMRMNETLINLTRLKRIITSEPITVDGNVKHYVLSLKNGIEKVY